MTIEETLGAIKPDGRDNNLDIIYMIEDVGLEIINQNDFYMSVEFAMEHYKHVAEKDRAIFNDLCFNYGPSGLWTALHIVGENSIQNLRNLTGITDPETAAPGTIRRLYGKDKKRIADSEHRATRNVFHCSGNPEEAESEIKKFYEAGYLI